MNFMIGFGLAALIFGTSAHAELVKKTVEYKEGSTVLEGYLVYDDAAVLKGALPGVLVIHNWLGLTDETKSKADAVASLGYVAFAADIYGKGIRPQGEAAGKVSGQFKADRALLRRRVQAGLSAMAASKLVDPKRTAAIGYCFGGTTALELARSGANLKSVVSFHGGLDSVSATASKNVKAKILVLHGADDPFVKEADLLAFQNEMRTSKVDWQMVSYGNAVHSFTEKAAGNDNKKGAAYNADADRRSWQAMRDFFAESL